MERAVERRAWPRGAGRSGHAAPGGPATRRRARPGPGGVTRVAHQVLGLKEASGGDGSLSRVLTVTLMPGFQSRGGGINMACWCCPAAPLEGEESTVC
ncbi:hypothetical protein EYF80_054780 [Liparis tanakae]|uniref:Uncharacterized protein n=1 Tax=Liparis tanakae TaxID=230148 RepID=A0A4Z2F1P7_9TELE|nr:hypothetical protein EYF80_054780 [Liparis tanakae]